jgi:uncharacterized protein YegL
MSNTPNKVDLANLMVAIAVDTSGTMRKTDAIPNSPLSRLKAVQENAEALADELSKADPTGMTIAQFAGRVNVFENVTTEKLEDVFSEFRPMGNTNTKEAMEKLINILLSRRSAAGAAAKPGFIICFTDGAPDDQVGLAQVIVDATKRIKDRTELGILFVQVGNDPDAAGYLAKLNDDLTKIGAAHDIVAVCKLGDLEGKTALELATSAFND